MQEPDRSRGEHIRIVLVGLGGWGRMWTRILAGVKGVQLSAAVDPSPRARAWAVQELGLPAGEVYEALETALERTECEAVIVATPMWTHYSQVRLALHADKHVLCEKPLAMSLEEARLLVELASRMGLVLAVDQNYRFRRPPRAVQRLLAEGALGQLVSIKLYAQRDTRAFWPLDDLRYRTPHFYLLDFAIHHLDLLRAVTGQNVCDVFSQGIRVPNSPYHHNAAGITVMELEHGATVTYESSYACYGPETAWCGEWDFAGEVGRLLWRGGDPDPNTGELTLELWGESPRAVELPNLPMADSAAVLQQFCAAVSTGTQPETSGADNLNSLAIVFSCIQSVETGGIARPADLLQATLHEPPPATTDTAVS